MNAREMRVLWLKERIYISRHIANTEGCTSVAIRCKKTKPEKKIMVKKFSCKPCIPHISLYWTIILDFLR